MLGLLPHVVAPGTNVLTTTSHHIGNGYTVMSGTSHATPYVAGGLALLLQLARESAAEDAATMAAAAAAAANAATTGGQEAGGSSKPPVVFPRNSWTAAREWRSPLARAAVTAAATSAASASSRDATLSSSRDVTLSSSGIAPHIGTAAASSASTPAGGSALAAEEAGAPAAAGAADDSAGSNAADGSSATDAAGSASAAVEGSQVSDNAAGDLAPHAAENLPTPPPQQQQQHHLPQSNHSPLLTPPTTLQATTLAALVSSATPISSDVDWDAPSAVAKSGAGLINLASAWWNPVTLTPSYISLPSGLSWRHAVNVTLRNTLLEPGLPASTASHVAVIRAALLVADMDAFAQSPSPLTMTDNATSAPLCLGEQLRQLTVLLKAAQQLLLQQQQKQLSPAGGGSDSSPGTDDAGMTLVTTTNPDEGGVIDGVMDQNSADEGAGMTGMDGGSNDDASVKAPLLPIAVAALAASLRATREQLEARTLAYSVRHRSPAVAARVSNEWGQVPLDLATDIGARVEVTPQIVAVPPGGEVNVTVRGGMVWLGDGGQGWLTKRCYCCQVWGLRFRPGCYGQTVLLLLLRV